MTHPVAGDVDLTRVHNPVGTLDTCVCGLSSSARIHTDDIGPDDPLTVTYPMLRLDWRDVRRIGAALAKAGIRFTHVELDLADEHGQPAGQVEVTDLGTDVHTTGDVFPAGHRTRDALAMFASVKRAAVDLLPGERVRLPGNEVRIVESVIGTGWRSRTDDVELVTVLFAENRWADWAQGVTTRADETFEVIP